MNFNTLYLILFALILLNVSPYRSAYPPASCELNNSAMEDLNVRLGFLELWEASRTNLPLNQRSEQGGWVVFDGNDGFEVIPFPPEWETTPCEIFLPADYLNALPSGLVGVVHTHPFHEGDNTTAPDVCGSDTDESYASGRNKDDLEFLVEIANHLSDFCIQGYVVDGSNVVGITPWGQESFYPVESFFQSVRVEL